MHESLLLSVLLSCCHAAILYDRCTWARQRDQALPRIRGRRSWRSFVCILHLDGQPKAAFLRACLYCIRASCIRSSALVPHHITPHHTPPHRITCCFPHPNPPPPPPSSCCQTRCLTYLCSAEGPLAVLYTLHFTLYFTLAEWSLCIPCFWCIQVAAHGGCTPRHRPVSTHSLHRPRWPA